MFRLIPAVNERTSFVSSDFLNAPSADAVDGLIPEADGICNHMFAVHDHGKVKWEPGSRPWLKWEPDRVRSFHRHDFLVTLVRANRVTKDRKYRQCYETLMQVLPECYPIKDVVKYDKAIDVAIRFLNWSAISTLIKKASWTQSELRYWFLQIEWIRANESPGGNHRLLEGLGVFAAGLYLNEIQKSQEWREHGQQIVLDEMQRQVAEDGIHASQSMYYHQVCATHFLKFFLICLRSGIVVPTEFMDRLQNMLQSIWWLKKPDGTHPMLGDGAQLVTQDREHWEARALIPVYDRLAGKLCHESNEAADWFLAKHESFPRFMPIEKAQRTSKIFPLSGHIVLQNDSGHYLFFNCGPLGYEPFPHHGHADALSVEICLNQKTIVMDPGGYAYKNDAIRKFVRSTAAHSTILVDNCDQSDLSGVFGVGRTAKVQVSGYRFSDDVDMVEALHTGYQSIIHLRRVYFVKKDINSFLVYDRVTGAGRHSLKLVYHLAPDVRCQQMNSYGYTLFVDEAFVGSTYFFSDSPFALDCIKNSDAANPKSIVSKRNGVVEFSTVLEASAEGELPLHFVTVYSSRNDLNTAFDWNDSQLTLISQGHQTKINFSEAIA